MSAKSPAVPVVLLHGWGGSFKSTWAASGWENRLRRDGRDVIPVDLPGHGARPASRDPADYADLVSLVRQQLPRDGVFDLVGYSLGAKIALGLAVTEPSLVRRAVLCGLGGNVFAPERVGEAVAAALEQGVTDQTPPSVAAFVRYGLEAGNDPLSIAAVLRRPPNPVLTRAQLERVTCDLLVVVGDRDATAQPVAPLLAALPRARHLTLPGVDHLSLPLHPDLLGAAVRFLG